MVPWLLGTALAAPAGYTQTDTTSDCAIYNGPKTAEGVTPLLAECVWPGVTLEKVDANFSHFDLHDDIFGAIVSSDIVRTEGGVSYVHQVHTAKGISERECVLKMSRSEEGGGVKFAWTLDKSSSTAADGRVPVAFDDGYWWFVPNPGGGVKVTYSLSYGPGGSVPSFMVRWFQGSGFEAAITELKAWLASR